MITFIPSSLKLIKVLVFCRLVGLALRSSLVVPLFDYGDIVLIVWSDKNNSALVDL